MREHRGKSEIRAADGGAVLVPLQAWLTTAGLEMAQLEVIRPNLETLYLNLTGRGLRE